MPFQVEKAAIPEILIVKPKSYTDERGFFMEAYQAREFAAAGIEPNFVQDNQSGSRRGTLRGLHYQIRQPQGKLVRVLVGEVFDVAVDLRRSSSTFGRWVGFCMSSKEQQQVWIPRGFAHGFYVTSDWAEVLYKTTDYYAPEWERTLRWNDPAVGIEWPIQDGGRPLLSDKDAHGATLAEADAFN
ncbi:MAG: dTDP-4-dehydrorhamnose 3,5-epimerase [Anaerolineales bacterium]|jgi:dTDP-4-dehydrorhamnose 3,5-epimerase